MANLNMRNGAAAAGIGVAAAVAEVTQERIVSRASTPPNVVVRNLGEIVKIGGGLGAVGVHMMANASTANRWGTEGAAYGGLAVAGQAISERVARSIMTPAPGHRALAGRMPSAMLPAPSEQFIETVGGRSVAVIEI